MCPRYCEFGFKRDISTGCPVCTCNVDETHCNVYVKADANGTATDTTASLTFRERCALNCENGFVKDDRGCDTCVCRKPEDACECTKPTNFVPLTCRDGSKTFVTDVCAKTATGCAYRVRECPLVIVIKVDTAFTVAELQALFDSVIRYAGTVGEDDVSIEKRTNSDGKIEYLISYERDTVPESDANGDPIAERIGKDETVSSRGGVSYVLSDTAAGTNTSFASVLIVPVLALLSLLM
jgi:hypothetical protein